MTTNAAGQMGICDHVGAEREWRHEWVGKWMTGYRREHCLRCGLLLSRTPRPECIKMLVDELVDAMGLTQDYDHDPKYLVKIIKVSDGRSIPPEEPIFILRGQDELAFDTVEYYAHLLAEGDGSPEAVDGVRAHVQEMKEWPRQKFPD